MDEIKQMAKTVAQCIKGDTKKTHGYDTAATVKRIDGGTAYVSIPAGVPETPVKKTIDAKVGDTVQVHVENGTAWLVGNQTAPPTDDAEALVAKAVAKVADQNATKAKTTADEAQATANAVSGIANTALSQAQEAKQIADDTEQHFWFTETGTDTGAHITEVTQEEWSDPSDPNYQSGGNLLARSNGIAVREGMKELATMSQDGFEAKTYDSGGIPVSIVHLGYGAGTNEQGGESNAPYYTLGTRETADSTYRNTQTYQVGDLVRYGSPQKTYCCTTAITTPEEWTASHWRLAIGNYSDAEGYSNTASGYVSHAEGILTTAIGTGSHAEGYSTIASDYYSHAEGHSTTASENYSHAEGYSTTASGDYSHAEGNDTTASGIGAHTEGYSTTANNYSHAEGYDTTASGNYSHSEGNSTTASNYYSHAEGYDTTASGFASHTQNRSTVAGYDYQTAIGKYNDNKSANLFEIGNGTSVNAKSNAFEVSNTGDITATGKATLGAINGDSLFAYTSISVTTSSISANASGEATSSASTLSGYYPLAITDVNISTGVASLRRFYFSTQQSGRAVVKIGVQNDGTSAKTISATAKILWVKTSV